MAKNPPPYILRNPGQLDRRFYDGFDHKFLFRKAQTLMYLFDQKEQFKELVTKRDEQSENTGSEYLASQDIDDKYFEGLKAEVYFTEMHQFEGFFALLLALFQELPHWLYLTTYKTGEIKTAVQNFLDGQIKAITNNKVDNKKDFIIHAIYAGFPLSDENREVTLENIGWFLERLGERYLEAVEYNAYKHGLRVLTGPSQFSLRLNDANGVAHGPSYVLRASWTVSEIHPDYGEDLFVRIFNKGVSRPLYFFVQSKGCENITDYLIQGGMVVSYPVSTAHIEDRKHFLEPVILTVWDSKTKIAYWQIVQ